MKPAAGNLARTVAGNTFWYGAELVSSFVAALLTSVAIARAFGPVRLSYFTYLQWLTNVSGALAMVGIPVTTRKYMAEYLARGDTGMTWAIFRSNLRVQIWIAGALVVAGGLVNARLVRPGYHAIALAMILTTALKLVVCIPSNANNAAEQLRANFIGGAVNAVTTLVGVYLSLWRGWGLRGVAAAACLAMAAELVVKTTMLLAWLPRPKNAVLPPDMRRRMFTFSGQGLVLMVLQLVVWDRSDLIFLKWMDRDPRQVTFFALAFNLIDKLLLLPQAFGQVVGISVMAEYGRNRGQLHRFVAAASKYGLLVSVPVMLGAAAMSGPLIRVVYGAQYLPVIAVLAIGAVLAVAKPMLAPFQSYLQAEENQGFLIAWNLVCGALNVILDVTLIPGMHARGAMLANGLAQAAALAGLWVAVARRFGVRVPAAETVKIALAGAIMAAGVWGLNTLGLPPLLLALADVPAGALIYFVLLRAFKVLDEADEKRLQGILHRLPAPAGRLASGCVSGMVRRAGAGA